LTRPSRVEDPAPRDLLRRLAALEVARTNHRCHFELVVLIGKPRLYQSNQKRAVCGTTELVPSLGRSNPSFSADAWLLVSCSAEGILDL